MSNERVCFIVVDCGRTFLCFLSFLLLELLEDGRVSISLYCVFVATCAACVLSSIVNRGPQQLFFLSPKV